MPDQRPDITVIIPVRNRPEQLLRALRSVLAQDTRPARLIVVDNASTDSTAQAAAEWLKSHPEVAGTATLLTETESGAPAARNRGLMQADTHLTVMLDSDDELLPGYLRRVTDLFAAQPDLELCYCDRMLRDSDGWTDVKAVGDDDLLRGHLLHCSLQTDAVTAATDLLRRAGAYDTSLPRWNDYELGVRLLLESRRTLRLTGAPGVLIHPQPDSITGTSYSRDAVLLERALDTIDADLLKAGRTHERRYVAARRAILAALYRREGAHDASRRLLDSVLNTAPGLKERIRLFGCYMAVALTGRGGAAIARLTMTPPRKQPTP